MSIKKPSFEIIRQLIPPLSHEFHKGQAGMGADLSHVLCHPSASTAIKVKKDDEGGDDDNSKLKENVMEKINSLSLSRFHVIVVGPGLSRDKIMFECAKSVILKAKKDNLPIVIDADALTLVQSQPELIKNYSRAVLTPNVNEFKRFCEKMDIGISDDDKEYAIKKLSLALGGVTIIQKGHNDLISNGDKVFVVDNDGGLKRCGGQGDILSGLVGTFLSWGASYKNKLWE
ncbi:11205_t:CDS:2 [Entrophospora sp. SA101]|nr:11205_t:CDS:2 [Entrophospora sp. SA101]CAJ0880573.1 1437_t:CDS:2 [Entrophospora sp. SA101]